jgi:DNA-binding MarR family transcriptional regulator
MSYRDAYDSFRWHVPPDFNIAHYACARWAGDTGRVALYWEDESGATVEWTYGELQQAANRLSNALRTNLTKAYLEDFELSLPEWRLLALVARFSPLRFSEVTARSGMDKGQVSRTLRVMASRGLTKMKVIRDRGSRSAEALAAPVMVSITAKGRTLYRAVLPVARRRQAEVLMTLSESDRYALYATLDKLFQTVGRGAADEDGE